MLNFVMFLLATIGLTNILVHGKVLDEIKLFGSTLREYMYTWKFTEALFSCYECTGFWAGIVCSFIFFSPTWYFVLACGFIGSVVCQTYTDLIYWLRSLIKFELQDDERQN